MENISTYYGIDWAAIILGLYAVYLLGNKRKIGFIFLSFIFYFIKYIKLKKRREKILEINF